MKARNIIAAAILLSTIAAAHAQTPHQREVIGNINQAMGALSHSAPANCEVNTDACVRQTLAYAYRYSHRLPEQLGVPEHLVPFSFGQWALFASGGILEGDAFQIESDPKFRAAYIKVKGLERFRFRNLPPEQQSVILENFRPSFVDPNSDSTTTRQYYRAAYIALMHDHLPSEGVIYHWDKIGYGKKAEEVSLWIAITMDAINTPEYNQQWISADKMLHGWPQDAYTVPVSHRRDFWDKWTSN
ncbi:MULTISPECIES: hypothetical protein [unclassified Caballeronia]|uniref:hypothetical protein n=1 Tax=unclassified Caballeronia TaxID=2646786 RepID=UPI00285877F3|nr:MULTISPECIES: hypothetical protein [unclassified Caballeronia]MDR5751140.1 hypothetical protein [Caballeronia sp. LZ024]MDR5844723.1 hypothetical protein [Caballeronia sp. LZ031]